MNETPPIVKSFDFNTITAAIDWFITNTQNVPSVEYQEGGNASRELIGRHFIFEVRDGVDGDGNPLTGILIYEIPDKDPAKSFHLLNVFRRNGETGPTSVTFESDVVMTVELIEEILLGVEASINHFREELQQPRTLN